jgi:hypothetical protein
MKALKIIWNIIIAMTIYEVFKDNMNFKRTVFIICRKIVGFIDFLIDKIK